MNANNTAIIKQDGNNWLGWIEGVPGVNEILTKKICKVFCSALVLPSCLVLLSCGLEESFKNTVNPCRKQTETISTRINNKQWRPVIDQMTNDFSFQYGDKIYKGKKKATGGKPFRNSIKRKDFISYSHRVTKVKKISKNRCIVDADATLKIRYKNSGSKEADWPLRFTWVKKGEKWKLASVNYLEKRKFIITKQPTSAVSKKDNAPTRAYATQEAAAAISSKSTYGASTETQRKVKQSIKDKVNDLSRRNRSRR